MLFKIVIGNKDKRQGYRPHLPEKAFWRAEKAQFLIQAYKEKGSTSYIGSDNMDLPSATRR